MKKFTLAAAAALSFAVAVPAVAETKVSDDPFVSTQGSWGLIAGGGGVAAAVIVVSVLAIAASGDS